MHLLEDGVCLGGAGSLAVGAPARLSGSWQRWATTGDDAAQPSRASHCSPHPASSPALSPHSARTQIASDVRHAVWAVSEHAVDGAQPGDVVPGASIVAPVLHDGPGIARISSVPTPGGGRLVPTDRRRTAHLGATAPGPTSPARSISSTKPTDPRRCGAAHQCSFALRHLRSGSARHFNRVVKGSPGHRRRSRPCRSAARASAAPR